MATVATAPGIPKSKFHWDSDSLSTLRDPRSPLDDFPSPQQSAASLQHPDLNIELATLSNKLISAINHQTHLDDALAATRQELESAQKRIRMLEALNQEHSQLVASGKLLRKEDVDSQSTRLTARLTEEKRQRVSVERDKKGIEQELESLTTALFEEANEMVSAARREREASERRSDQLRIQLKETESLLASHQEQLTELKQVMAQMNETREDMDHATSNSTAPSTPALPSQSEIDKATEAIYMASAGNMDDVHPGPPTSFSHLISPVLRTNLMPYDDFKALLEISRRSAPSSRVNSGSYGSVGVPAASSSSTAPSHAPSLLLQQLHGAQATTYSAHSMGNSTPVLHSPLKETKFYKRALAEDIEPTMRLDAAPGLSWLARRSVMSSMCEGSLVVEPMPASTRMSVFSCSLCGEHKQDKDFTRTHRFRTSESDSAQRYPLCGYCLNRLRATCDFLSFLRMVKDGYWRTDGEEAEKAAWEESVRLRERMFWARIGGGVVPSFLRHDSSQLPVEDSKPGTPFSAPATIWQTGRYPGKENGGPANRLPSTQWLGHQSDNESSASSADYGSQGTAQVVKQSASQSSNVSSPIPAINSPIRKPRSQAMSYGTQTPETPSRSTAPQATKTRSSTQPPSSKDTKPSADGALEISIPGGFDS